MTLDPSISAANRASTARIRFLADRLTDDELRTPVGEHWTVAITLVHLSFWDRRALDVLERRIADPSAPAPVLDVVTNDLALPGWAAIPPRDACRLAIEAADEFDARMEAAPDAVIESIRAENPRWVNRSLHRNPHLDEAEAALR
jgi:hypothetical protein